MSTKHSRTPSPSIHEALIDRHLARDPATKEPMHDVVIGAMSDAMRAAREAAERAHRIATVIHENENMTVPARHRRAREEAWKAVEGCLTALDRARERAVREVGEIDQRTSAPPRPADAASAMLASEIRSRLAGMTPEQRRAAIGSALADGDDAVLGAVLNAPPMLSGVESAAAHNLLRQQWRTARHGADVDRMGRIGKAIADIERAGTLIASLPGKLADSKIVSAAEEADRAMQRAIGG